MSKIKKLAISSLILALLGVYGVIELVTKAGAKNKPLVEATKVEYQYSIGENAFRLTPVKYCHIINGVLYIVLTDKTTLTTMNPMLICGQEKL